MRSYYLVEIIVHLIQTIVNNQNKINQPKLAGLRLRLQLVECGNHELYHFH